MGPAFLKRRLVGRPGTLLLLAVAASVLFFGLARMSGPRPAPSEGGAGPYDVGTNPTRQMKGFVDHFGNLVDRQGKELAAQAAELQRLKTENDEARKGAEELRGEIAQLKAALRARAETDDPLKRTVDELKRQFGSEGAESPADPVARLRKVTLPDARKEGRRLRAGRQVRLPAGSFAQARLLTGAFGPVTGQPMPVQLRVDEPFVGPNRTRIPIQEAFLIGKATGDPNSERMVIQLDRLSYAKPGGQTTEVQVNGYVVDDDGVQGVSGKYVWRAFEGATLATLSGALSAGADAAAARETLTQVNPLGGTFQAVTGDPLRFAGFRGLSRAGEEIEKLVARRLEEITPAVYVPNGRRVTVCLIDGVTLENVSVDEMKHDQARDPFDGLDLGR